MIDEEIFQFDQEPCSSALVYDEVPDTRKSVAPPPSPEEIRKNYCSGSSTIAMEQLARKLNSLNEPRFEDLVRPRAETISTLPSFSFQQDFVSSNFFGLYKSTTVEDEDEDEDEMECEDSAYTSEGISINQLSHQPYNELGSCDQSPVNVDSIPIMMGGFQSECYKMNSLKRRTNDNNPYPMAGSQRNDISKKSRSTRTGPPILLFSHLSQSAPR